MIPEKQALKDRIRKYHNWIALVDRNPDNYKISFVIERGEYVDVGLYQKIGVEWCEIEKLERWYFSFEYED